MFFLYVFHSCREFHGIKNVFPMAYAMLRYVIIIIILSRTFSFSLSENYFCVYHSNNYVWNSYLLFIIITLLFLNRFLFPSTPCCRRHPFIGYCGMTHGRDEKGLTGVPLPLRVISSRKMAAHCLSRTVFPHTRTRSYINMYVESALVVLFSKIKH